MKNQSYNIGVMIPVHNRLKQTIECLRVLEENKNSLFFQQNTIYILVADDGSVDGTNDYIKKHYPQVIVLKGNGNLWWSGGMNLLIRYALKNLDIDFALLWENDMEPFHDYFEQLQLIINKWDHKSIICSKIYYMNDTNKIYAMGGIFNGKTGYKKVIGRLENDSPQYQQVIEADWFCGQGILIHKNIFEAVGLFDEKVFPQYHGDSDFALRAKKAGYKVSIYPQLRITNDISTTGLSHIKNKTTKQFIETLISIRSNTNISKDLRFYYRHTTSILAYFALFHRYSLYIGGFIKWKTLGWFGIEKKYSEFY